MKKKDPNNYPPGLSAAKVKRIIDYYDNQSDEEAACEIENATFVENAIWMRIPSDLVPKVRQLLARQKKTA